MLFVKLLSLGLLVSSVLLSTAEAEDSAAPPAPVQIKFSADAWSRYSFMCYESLNPKCGDQAISPYYMHIHSSLSLFDQKKDEAIAKQSFNNSDWSQFQFTQKERLQRYQDAKGCKDNLDTLANLNKGPSGQCALQGQKPVAAITSEVKTQPKLQAGDSCPAVQIPNGGGFGGQFLKGLAADPDDPTVLYGMTQNFDGPSAKNMAFLSKSTDGGKTWVLIQRIEDQANSATPIFSGGIDVKIPLVVGKGSPKSFVFGSKVGLFQIVPPSSSVQALRKPAATSAKETVGANDIKLSEDGERMVVSINHQNPGSGEVVEYKKSDAGIWEPVDSPLPPLDAAHMVPPIAGGNQSYSVQVCGKSRETYVGMGSYSYHFDSKSNRWLRITGMESGDRTVNSLACEPDGGLEIATCGGVYRAKGNQIEQKYHSSSFLFNRSEKDDHREIPGGSVLRAQSVDSNSKQGQIVVGTARGVFFSSNGGTTWQSANETISSTQDWKTKGPEDKQEFRTTHVNPDGSFLVSGFRGTYLLNKDGSCATK